MRTLRQAFADRVKQALKARKARTLSTVRPMLAALRERDIAARGQGNVAPRRDLRFARVRVILRRLVR
jgi:uncharacterized protein